MKPKEKARAGMHEEEHPFYGYEILRERQHALIDTVLAKYKGRAPDDALKKEIYEELQSLKAAGQVTIPFKVVLRRDLKRPLKNYVEVILDTKV